MEIHQTKCVAILLITFCFFILLLSCSLLSQKNYNSHEKIIKIYSEQKISAFFHINNFTQQNVSPLRMKETS